MKYIMLNDIRYTLRQEFKIIIIYLSVAFLCPIFLSYDQSISIERLIYGSLGFGLRINDLSIFEKLIFCFSIIVYLYLLLKVFTKDILNDVENLFLRISTKQWLFYKIISIFLISLCLLFLYYGTANLVILLLKKDISIDLFHLFIRNIEFIYCLQLLILIIYVAYYNKKNNLFYLLVITIIFVLVFWKRFINWNITDCHILVTIFILMIIIFTIISKNMKYIFEKIKEKMI